MHGVAVTSNHPNGFFFSVGGSHGPSLDPPVRITPTRYTSYLQIYEKMHNRRTCIFDRAQNLRHNQQSRAKLSDYHIRRAAYSSVVVKQPLDRSVSKMVIRVSISFRRRHHPAKAAGADTLTTKAVLPTFAKRGQRGDRISNVSDGPSASALFVTS